MTGAAVAFTMPATPGTYNVRFFLNDSLTKLATSATITVTAAAPSIALSATTVVPGGTVTATIANGPGNAGDWVGLFGAERRGRDVPGLEVSERDADQAGERGDRRGRGVHDAGDAGDLQRAVLPERFVDEAGDERHDHGGGGGRRASR